MEVFEKAGDAALNAAYNINEKILGQQEVCIYVSNGTSLPLQHVKGRSSTAQDAGTGLIQPGHAGSFRASAKGDVSLAVEIVVGNECLVIAASNPRLGSPSAAIEFREEMAGITVRPVQWIAKATCRLLGVDGASRYYHNKGKAYSASVSFAGMGNMTTAHVNVGPRVPPGEPPEAPLTNGFDGIFLLENLESPQLISFVMWCATNAVKTLPHALFLMELAAVQAGLDGLLPSDQAFMMDLLIIAFVASGLLSLSPDAIQLELQNWKQNCLPDLEKSAVLDYAAYRKRVGASYRFEAYADTCLVLLKTAALQCGPLVTEAILSWQKLHDTRAARSKASTATSSAASSANLTEQCKLLGQHMRSEANSRVSSAKEQTHEQVLQALVRSCIHASADFSKQTALAYEALKKTSLVSEDTRNALDHYRRWVPAARRRFYPTDVNDVTHVSLGGRKKKRRCWFCKKRRRPAKGTGAADRPSCESLGEEVFTGLDDGVMFSPGQILSSLGVDSLPYKSLSTNSKSGEFFWFSGDRRFILKTVSVDEGMLLFRMLAAYQHHLYTMPRSLIVRYAGFFCLELPGPGGTSQIMYITIMASVFDPSFPIDDTYDVKGSTFKRKAKKGEKIKKDEDWVKAGELLQVKAQVCAELCAAHERDALFLMSFGVMDYSVLIGIHRVKEGAGNLSESGDGWREKNPGILAHEGSIIYFVGIIDFLIWFGLSKKGEHLVRTIQGHGEDASCVDPLSYARRQVRFVRDRVVAPSTGCGGGKGAVPMGTHGALIITIISCSNLINTDLVGKSDPFCWVIVGLQRLRTPTINNNHDPQWNCTLLFSVDEMHVSSHVDIQVMDEDDRIFQGSDDSLGNLSIPVERVISEGILELTEPLRDVKHGKISVRLEFQAPVSASKADPVQNPLPAAPVQNSTPKLLPNELSPDVEPQIEIVVL